MEPSYRRSRREALVSLLAWFLAGVWVISVSSWLSYGQPVSSIGGIPNWVLWGVFLPWLVFFLHNCWYSLFYIREDDDTDASADDPEAGKR